MRGVIPAGFAAGIDRRNPPRNFQYTNALGTFEPPKSKSTEDIYLLSQLLLSTQNFRILKMGQLFAREVLSILTDKRYLVYCILLLVSPGSAVDDGGELSIHRH